MNLDEMDFKSLTAIMVWAYENEIIVELSKRRGWSDANYPVLRFSRGDKHIEQALYNVFVNKSYFERAWQEVGFKLCVEPPDFKRFGI